MDKAVDLLAFIDISRRNIERAMKAENFYSAAFLAGEMMREVEALKRECTKVAKRRHQ